MRRRWFDSKLGFLFLVVTLGGILVSCLSVLAGGQCERWAPTNGPFGGDVNALAIDPQTPSTVYAAANGGVFRSTDAGANWNRLRNGLPLVAFQTLAIDPQTPSIVYAGTTAGFEESRLYVSVDGGGNWSRYGIPTSTIDALAIDPQTPSIVYAGTSEGVWRSTNRGETWTPVNEGLIDLNVLSLVIDPQTPSTVYAGTARAVFRSTDAGGSWVAASLGIPWAVIRSLAIDPLDPATLYAATDDKGMYRTTTSGGHWDPINTGLPNESYLSAVVVDPLTPTTLYAATFGGGIFRSVNRGGAWTSVSNGLEVLHGMTLAIDPVTPARLYAGMYMGGMYRSVDSGASWMSASSGLTSLEISSLVVDPMAPATLYAAGGGVYRSSDRGANWAPANNGLGRAWAECLALDPVSPNTLYVGTIGGVFRTTNGGADWTAVRNGLERDHPFVLALAIDPVTRSTIYAGTDRGVFRSTDSAATWAPANAGLPGPYFISVDHLVIDPHTPSTLYAGTSGGLYRSMDRGDSWTEVTTLFVAPQISCLAIDSLTPAGLYVGIKGGGLLRSTDGGWLVTDMAELGVDIVSLAIDPLTPTTVYAATEDRGVFRSTDRGLNWTALNTGLTDVAINSLAIDPTAPSTLYAGVRVNAVFQLRSDCGLHFSQFGNGLGFTSQVVLTNPSSSAAVTGAVASADDQGTALSIGLGGGPNFSIPPLGALTLATDGTGPLSVGSAAVSADGPVGGVIRFGIPGIGIAGVGASQPMSGFIAPVRRRNGGVNTGVAIANHEDYAVTLDLTLRNEQGQQVAGGRQTIPNLPAHGRLARFIDELFPDAGTDPFIGSLVVEASRGQILAAAMELGPAPGEFTTLPVTPLVMNGLPTQLFFSQFGEGAGFTSDTVLVNPLANAEVSGTIMFFGSSGQPMDVNVVGLGLQWTVPFSIPPLGATTIWTMGLGDLRVGSAWVDCSGPVGGVVRFRIPGTGIAGVGGSQPMSRLVVPVRRTADGIRTGIALANPTFVPMTVTLTLRDRTGAPVPGGTPPPVSLVEHGHLALFVDELFPDANTDNFEGTVSVEVTGPVDFTEGQVAATAMELGSKPGEFTTLPVTPME